MLEGVVNIAAAAVLLPGFTVVAFVFLVGSWAVFTGILEVAMMIGKIVRASTLTFVITALAVNMTAASTVYDGSWSLSVITNRGSCAPTHQFEIQIRNGVINYQGPASVNGRVSSGGEVRVSVSSEGSRASGSGRLSRTSGRGTWSGRSTTSGEACSGHWSAHRS
jgi:hypothetical protein